jgi:hypothetical protein
MMFSPMTFHSTIKHQSPREEASLVEVRGIEPRSSSRLVSLSFTCVVAMSLATEFVDSAYDLFSC